MLFSRDPPAVEVVWSDRADFFPDAGGPAFSGVELAVGGIEAIESLLCQLADPPQWMAGVDPLLDRHVGEQRAGVLPLTSHQ